LHTFRLYWNFGVILLERAAAGILGKYQVSVDLSCQNIVASLLARNKGLIVISAHVGAWQAALTGLDFGIRVNILQPKQTGDVDLHFFEHTGNQSINYRLIDSNNDFGGFIEARAALKNGEIVCLMGDRLMPEEKLIINAPFLGEDAFFPASPYALAAITGAPLLVIFMPRVGECSAANSHFATIDAPRIAVKNTEQLKPLVEQFASLLEKFCLCWPYQYFNFHNLWKAEDNNDA
jgi:predicted LPLAT superfamily acyltransferase